MRRAELVEPLASPPREIRVAHRLGEQVDDLVVTAEVGEVFERQVDRAAHRAGTAQIAELVALTLSAGHVTTIHFGADAPLHSG